MMEEEKQIKIFRANPVPKFIKARATTVGNHNNYNNNNNKNEAEVINNLNKNGQNANFPDKRIRKRAEVIQ